MAGFVSSLNASHPQTGHARSPGSTPNTKRSGKAGPAISFSVAPDATPCSSGAASSPRAQNFPARLGAVLKGLNGSLASSLAASFLLKYK